VLVSFAPPTICDRYMDLLPSRTSIASWLPWTSPQKLHRRRLQLLLITLVVLILVYPLFKEAPEVLSLLMTIVLAAAVWTLSEDRWGQYGAVGLGLPHLTTIWLMPVVPSWTTSLVRAIVSALFYGFTTVIVLRHLLRTRQVVQDTLYGAASAYLLLGLSWAFLYAISDLLQPGAIISASGGETGWIEYVYFSFVTLTTLGYGDLVPGHASAQSLAILQSVVGTLYVAVLVSQFVEQYAAQRDR